MPLNNWAMDDCRDNDHRRNDDIAESVTCDAETTTRAADTMTSATQTMTYLAEPRKQSSVTETMTFLSGKAPQINIFLFEVWEWHPCFFFLVSFFQGEHLKFIFF